MKYSESLKKNRDFQQVFKKYTEMEHQKVIGIW